MKLPTLNPIRVKSDNKIIAFTGLNRNPRINDNEIADCKKIGLKNLGIGKPRT